MSNSQIINCHAKDCNVRAKLSCKGTWGLTSEPPSFGGLVGQGSGDGKSLTSCSYDGYMHFYVSNNHFYAAGLMAQGSPTLSNCKVSGTMEITLMTPRNTSNGGPLYCNGLCYEAEDIYGCLSTMKFIINNADDLADGQHEFRKELGMYGLCTKAKNITKSAYCGEMDIKSLSDFHESSRIGSVGTVSKSISDCAFYCCVEGRHAAADKKFRNSKISFYPFLTEETENANRVVVINDYFYNTDENKSNLVLKTPQISSSNKNIFSYGYNSISDDVFNQLKTLETGSAVWGKSDASGMYKGFPLPLACGGNLNGQLNGKGTEAEPYLIGSEEELRALAAGVNNGSIETEGKYFALTSDIDFSASTEVFPSIGTANKYFKGTFDGKGHVISNIKQYHGLFYYLCGTLKNLAVVGVEFVSDSKRDQALGALAINLGSGSTGGSRKGTITNCYVGGDITIGKLTFSSALVGGLCGFAENGTIENSYFKGNIHINDTPESFKIGGLLGEMKNVTVSDSYASFETDPQFGVYGIVAQRKDPKGVIKGCYFVCDHAIAYDNLEKDNRPAEDIVNKCSNESVIFGDYDYTSSNSTWMKGAYRPVLRSARTYEVTLADGSDTKTYLDAIPMADSNNTSNDILHADASKYENDKLLWALPNLAVYNPAEKTDYILNCTLDPTKPLNYTQKPGSDMEYVKVNMHYPLTITKDFDNNAQHYYPLCLPGTVYLDNLPNGSKLYVGGTVYQRENSEYNCLNVVEADSVAGGVPFIAYIPQTEDNVAVKVGDVIDIVMRSRMALEPQTSLTVDGKEQQFDLRGTFKGEETVKNLLKFIQKNEAGDIYIGTRVSAANNVAPFSSYLSYDASQVQIVDYLLLDEMSNETERIVNDGDDGHNHKIMLRRTLYNNEWNTICLPFDMTAEEVAATFGEGTKLEEYKSLKFPNNGGQCQLNFVAVDEIKAGESYLIRPTAVKGNSYTLDARKISKKIIESIVDPSTSADTVKFVGTYRRMLLGDGYGEKYFIQGSKVYHVAEGQRVLVNGFRCYIALSKYLSSKAMANATIVHSDGSATALRLVEADSSTDDSRIYNLQGIEQKDDTHQHGIYIKGGRKYVK